MAAIVVRRVKGLIQGCQVHVHVGQIGGVSPRDRPLDGHDTRFAQVRLGGLQCDAA
jgi:hypothetical protein